MKTAPLALSLATFLALSACGPGAEAPDPTAEARTVRAATWNIQGVGAEGSPGFDAAVAVLLRLDADLVGLNEVDQGEDAALHELAALTGYDHVLLPDDNPFGPLRNAVLSRLPVIDEVVWTSSALSSDADANDMTRLPVSVTVDAGPATVSMVVQHWKAGFEDIDHLRRAVESLRAVDALGRAPGDHSLLVGDVNHEVDQGPGDPPVLTAVPSGAPWGFQLGADLEALLDQGIGTDPFEPLWDADLRVLDAEQADGRPATRDSSGRRIDYVAVDPDLVERVLGTLVYDSRDDDQVSLNLEGNRPDRAVSAEASDHFPVVVELRLGGP